MTHYDITMGNDIARDAHCDITMSNEVMCIITRTTECLIRLGRTPTRVPRLIKHELVLVFITYYP